MNGSRLLDITVAAMGLTVCAPVIALAAIGIAASSPGPLFYRARRVGLHGRPFTMHKLRTMQPSPVEGAPITAPGDHRVFLVGSWFRRTKIDELPQLWNILRGDMALVGPRPEDPAIVSEHYDEIGLSTLEVRPGLTSPGTIYYYAFAEKDIDVDDPVGSYLPIMRTKLALDSAYVAEASVSYDLSILAQTLTVVLSRVFNFSYHPRLRGLDRVHQTPSDPSGNESRRSGPETPVHISGHER